jgi:hypothetical protein
VSKLAFLGSTYEVRTSGKGGDLTPRALSKLIKQTRRLERQYSKVTFLFPINTLSDKHERKLEALKRELRSQGCSLEWFGPEGCDNLLKVVRKTDAELHQRFLDAFRDPENHDESEETDGDGQEEHHEQ